MTCSLWWVPPGMPHCWPNIIWKPCSFAMAKFQKHIPMNWAHLRCWKISLPCFCFQIHHSTSLRPSIEKHYLNGGDSTTETDYEFIYPLELRRMTKIFWRDMLTFLVWHLDSPTSWDPLLAAVDRVALWVCPASQYCEIPRKIPLQLPEETQSPTRGWYPWNSQSAFDAVAFLLNTSHNFGNNGCKEKNIINFSSRSM